MLSQQRVSIWEEFTLRIRSDSMIKVQPHMANLYNAHTAFQASMDGVGCRLKSAWLTVGRYNPIRGGHQALLPLSRLTLLAPV